MQREALPLQSPFKRQLEQRHEKYQGGQQDWKEAENYEVENAKFDPGFMFK